ncbi:GerW family sporulation protein [Antarctobacter sp.]|uniref:GerW family sporulation protein n=1 Tax=Antarctobacter sp. TaxID=1872577 RepID=UPI002B26D770|nr:spore germination protein GerW family protein [Antarctobacter sp.]
MEDVERLLKGTVEELEKLLNAKNVLGDPIERDGATVIPIVSYGFGFGAGGGTGSDSGKGAGAGTGAGGGIRPLGAIIIDQNGARVEAVKGAANSLAAAVTEVAGKVISAVDRDRSRKDTEA